MEWAGTLRPYPVTGFATRSGTPRAWCCRWRRPECLLLGVNLPQAVPRNLLLQRRAAMIQQLLKVLFRGLHIVLGQGCIPQANFFSHDRPPPHKTVCIPLPMGRGLARPPSPSRRRFCRAPTSLARLGETASALPPPSRWTGDAAQSEEAASAAWVASGERDVSMSSSSSALSLSLEDWTQPLRQPAEAWPRRPGALTTKTGSRHHAVLPAALRVR